MLSTITCRLCDRRVHGVMNTGVWHIGHKTTCPTTKKDNK